MAYVLEIQDLKLDIQYVDRGQCERWVDPDPVTQQNLLSAFRNAALLHTLHSAS